MAIFNMTVGAGIRVGHNKTLIKEVKQRGYTFEGCDATPITGTSGDWFTFTRNGVIYFIYHAYAYDSPSDSIYKYDPKEETFTLDTEMSLPPGRRTPDSYGWMHTQHYLYDPNTDTVHFAVDYNGGSTTDPRLEYKFDFATATWTKLTALPFIPAYEKGCDWTINSAGTIAVGYNVGSTYAPCILQGTTWTQLQAAATSGVRYIYNADDELCAVTGINGGGLYVFDGSTWEKQYTLTYQLTDVNARIVTVDNEGNIAQLGYFRDYGRVGTASSLSEYAKYAFAGIFTKEAADALPYITLRGIGSNEEAGSAGRYDFFAFERAAISWEGNVGYLFSANRLTGYSGIRLIKVKPVYKLVES